jgi:hypothetical protein
MTDADESSPSYCPPVPDTAMATGSEDGDPGEQPDEARCARTSVQS